MVFGEGYCLVRARTSVVVWDGRSPHAADSFIFHARFVSKHVKRTFLLLN